VAGKKKILILLQALIRFPVKRRLPWGIGIIRILTGMLPRLLTGDPSG
jgi:hypothetical protein